MKNITLKSKPSLVAILFRSLMVGIAYGLASSLVAAVFGPLSRLASTLDNALVS